MKNPMKHKLSKLMLGFFACMVIFASAMISVSAYGYNTNILTNGTPSSTSSWTLTNSKWQNGDYGGEFKSTKNAGPMTATQTVKLTARDKIRANNGELTVYGSAFFWAQPSCKIYCEIQISALNSSGSVIWTKKTSHSEYKVKRHEKTLTTSTYTLPAGTASIKFYAKNEDSLSSSSPPSMRSFKMVLKDTAAPTFVSGAPKTAAGKYKKGSVISYALKFSEPVNVSNSGTLSFTVGSQTVNASYDGVSSDGTEVLYKLTLPSTSTRGNNLSVKVKSISGLVVKDDSGNSRTVTTTSGLNSSSIYLDNKEPEISSMGTAASADAVYTVGETISFTATFDEYIKVSGSPVITLSNGKNAVYKKPATTTDTNAAEFTYTVSEGDDTTALNITAVKLNGITDSIGNTAISAPSYSETKHNSFLNNYNIAVDTTGPVVTFPTLSEWTCDFSQPPIIEDEISGVSEVYGLYSELFSVTPESEHVLPETYIVSIPAQTGEYYIVIKAIDSIGNVSVSHSETTYKFDFTNPTVVPEYIFLETDGEDLISDITVIADDEHSGIAEVTYKWYDKDNSVVLSGNVDNGIEFPDLDGVYKISIAAKDNTGNVETVEKHGLYIDATAPVAEFVGIESVYEKSHSIDIKVFDEKCAVVEYSYIISDNSIAPDFDDEGWVATEETSFTTPENVEGVYYIHIKTLDECGNEGIVTSPALLVDNLPPSIFVLPESNEGNVGKAEYTVAVTVSDGVSVYSELLVEYAITEDEEFPDDGFLSLVDGGVSVELAGKNLYLHVRAVDKAGNMTTYTSGLFEADITAPVGYVEKKEDKYYTNINTVPLIFSAEDDYCEDIEMQIKVDETELAWEKLADEKTVTFDEAEGVHYVSVRFRDEAGNVSEYTEQVEYFYDITAPVITLIYSETEPTNSDVTVTALVKDESLTAEFISVSEKLFTSNGEFEFSARDGAGNIVKTVATVDNIDKILPEISFESDAFDGKNHQTVTINVIANDANGISSLEYCLDDSGEYVPVDENSVTISGFDESKFITVRAVDGVGNVAIKTSPNVYLDNTAPVGTIVYTPSGRTAQNVTAVITFNEEVTITNNDGSNTYVFEDNGEFTFEFVDEAGNTSEVLACVTWIDRAKPVGRIALYDDFGNSVDAGTWVNYNLNATIVPPANARIERVYFNGVDVSEAEGIETIAENSEYVISVNGTLRYDIIDTETFVKGEGEVYIRIDKEAPIVSEEDILYSETSWTNKDVTVRITAKDNLSNVTYTNGNSFVFEENGTHEYVFVDEAGNENSISVEVENIDKSVPEASVTYFIGDEEFNNNSFTNKDVTAVINFADDGLSPITITNNDGNNCVTFRDNGSFVFEFTDEAGNTGSIIASTDKIDKTAPTGYVVYSTSGWTNSDVTVTLIATDDNGEVVITNNDSENYVFTENGEFTFEFCDSAGNASSVTAFYDRIDKDAPVLNYSLSINETTAFAVYAYVEANERVTYLNNEGSPTRRFNSNGSYTIKAVDRAGNTSELVIVVSNISKESTPVYIEYSETELTNNDVYATIKPQNPSDVIYVTNNDSGKTHKFTENGDFVFYYKNAAGIEGEAAASVTNIDKTAPEVSVSYSHDSITNEDVIVTIESDEELCYPYYAQGGEFTFTENATYTIPVSDLVGNTTYVTVETNLIDKVAPVISVPYKNVALKIGEEFDVMDGVEATDDVAEMVEISVTGDIDVSVEGIYTITYTARDIAGNTTEESVTVSVYDPTKFNVIVNGIVVSGDTVTVDSRDVDFEIINAEGNVALKLDNGKKKTGVFKKNHNYIAYDVQFEKNGIYTIYIQDAERHSKLFWLYVIENK